MGDVAEYWRDHKNRLKERRRRFGINCPKCSEVRPRTNPSILLPGQRCKVDGYQDPRDPKDYRDE